MMEVDVAFSGSSTKITGHAGFAKHIEERLQPVRVAGSSGGAIIAAAWAVHGATKIKDILMDLDFQSYAKKNWWSLLRFGLWGYLSNGKRLRETLKEMLGGHTFSSPDLKFDLYVTAANMTKGCLEVYSKETTPDLSLDVAVYRSACLPGVFKPQDAGPYKIRDGSIYKDFPLDLWDDYVRPRVGHYFGTNWHPTTAETWNGILEHRLTLARMVDDNLDITLQFLKYRHNNPFPIIATQSVIPDLGVLDFDVSNTKKERVYMTGYNSGLLATNELLFKA